MTSLRIAVLASGRGSNLQALLDGISDRRLDARLVGVFSDKPASGAMERARAAQVEAHAFAPRDYPDRAAHDDALFSAVAAVQPDLIVCAGYMRLISEGALRRFEGRMINIHPSLLPAYPGLDTHARALAAGEREHGASVHVVTPALDAGPVLAQARVPVLSGDDAGSLARRVLEREHPLLLASVQLIAAGRIRLGAETITFDGQPLAAPLQLGADNRLGVH